MDRYDIRIDETDESNVTYLPSLFVAPQYYRSASISSEFLLKLKNIEMDLDARFHVKIC
jgi:hypothetical protein